MTRPNAWQPTKNERRYLARFGCGLCEMPLNLDSCGSIYGPPCSEEVRRVRRENCLKGYKPRTPPPSGAAPGEGA